MNNTIYDVIEKVSSQDGTLIEILQIPELSGSSDVSLSSKLYFASNTGMRLKMVRISLNNSFTSPNSTIGTQPPENILFVFWRRGIQRSFKRNTSISNIIFNSHDEIIFRIFFI